jgi:hypothetical protein
MGWVGLYALVIISPEWVHFAELIKISEQAGSFIAVH